MHVHVPVHVVSPSPLLRVLRVLPFCVARRYAPPMSHPLLLALDVDGVLTDGGIFVGADGLEIKRYHAADGIALRTWSRLGLQSAVITGRRGPAISHRLADLGVPNVIQGSKDKGRDLDELIRTTGVPADRIAYMGDDWPDLPILRRVGYPMAPINAAEPCKKVAKFISARPGGSGAVRDAVEHLLTLMGRIDEAVRLYDK